MIPLGEAQQRVLEAVAPLPAGPVPLSAALGLVLAGEVVAPESVPPFANSAMDGYAVRGEDVVTAPVELEVAGDLPAGRAPDVEVGPGRAVRIMTGAPLPLGADTVVRVEDTQEVDDRVRILLPTPVGTAIRPAGGDVAQGQPVFGAGTRLSPAHLAVLATLGVDPVIVIRRPRVAICATGDELVPSVTASLRPGAIRDSNRPLLLALLAELGVSVIDLGIVPDDYELLRDAFARAASEADALLSTGGVSMGEHDLVKKLVTESGRVDLWQVAIQPAKPFAFGWVGGIPFFGLPGNPVSVMVAFEQLARPALLRMMGSRALFRPRVKGRTRVALLTDPAKTVFVRVRTWEDQGIRWAEPSGSQASNVLTALAAADAFAVVPQGVGEVPAGGEVVLELFRLPEARELEAGIAPPAGPPR